MSNLFIGIIIIVIGGALINFGIVIQKRQINIKQKLILDESRESKTNSFLNDPLWILGILMQTILCLPFILIGLDYLGPALAQPLSNGCVVFLVIGLVWIVGEKITRSETIGILLLIIGMIATGFGEVTGEITLLSFLNENIPKFTIFMVVLLILSTLLLVIGKIHKFKIVSLGLLIGIFNTFVTISMQILLISFDNLNLVQSKLMLFFGIIGIIISTLFAILASQEAFKIGQAVNIIPFSQLTMNLFPVFAGLYVFNQLISNSLIYWIGLITIIISASMLSRFQK